MKIEYYPDTDTLYISLADRPSVESEEIAPDVVADFDIEGNIVGLEVEHASTKTDLTSIETSALPLLATKSA